jgi:hypothetical protein
MARAIGGKMFDQIRVNSLHGLFRSDLVLVDLLLEHMFFDNLHGDHLATGRTREAQGLVQSGYGCLRKVHPHNERLECLHDDILLTRAYQTHWKMSWQNMKIPS